MDVTGLVLTVLVTAASVQDRDATIVYWAMIITMSRRLARQHQAPRPRVTLPGSA